MNKFTIQKPFAISAGAGSGKTYTLSRRYINALLGFDYFREDYSTQKSYFDDLKAAKVKQIVTITYTEAAALEMKGRIFELVSKIIDPNLSSDDGDAESIQQANEVLVKEEGAVAFEYVKSTLNQALQESSNARISTIHAFCLDIIKANADIARIDTQLDIVKEDEKAKLLSHIVFEVLDDEKNRETVLNISKDVSVYFLNGLIEKYVSSSKFRNDYDSFSKKTLTQQEYKALIAELYPLPDVEEALEEVKSYLADSEIEEKEKYVGFLNDYIDNFKNFQATSWSALSKEQDITIAFNRRPWTRHKELKPYIEEIKSLDGYADIYRPIENNLEDLFFDKIEQIETLLHQIKSRYDAALHEEGKTDFDTIITRTEQIIGDVKTDFKYIMVDEFQDTNATQFEIVRNAAQQSGANLFVVGDSKQSIYSFQGAEIEVFNDAVDDRDLFVSNENMSVNYRSDGVVLRRVNVIFKRLLRQDKYLKHIAQNYEARAQKLHVSKAEKESRGSFRCLITSQPYNAEEKADEMESIADFIEAVVNGKMAEYAHITERIDKKEKAIAVLFDGGDKMLELRSKLKDRGISAKISKSDNFYHTKEVNDIFHVLKSVEILSKCPEAFSDEQKYYLAGAMRSNILRVDENCIYHYLNENKVDERLDRYVDLFQSLPLSQVVKRIYDESNVMGVYAHLDDADQRSANLNKFLLLCKEYEEGSGQDLHHFLSTVENAIFFSEAKEDEAFYRSDNTHSIELCTIHATKGLAYPLVLLANADKGLNQQVNSDALKHNNFKMDGRRREIVGFKVGDYMPLSHRVLKELDKRKHLAEKKRLLYVALTRAEHDVVISAKLSEKQDGGITLGNDSYLHMIIDALHMDKETLYHQDHTDCIVLQKNGERAETPRKVEYVDHTLPPITFAAHRRQSATSQEDEVQQVIDREAADRGTLIHKIIELYWNRFAEHSEEILYKMGVFDAQERRNITESMERFYDSDVYALLKEGVEHHIELAFNDADKSGSIDLIYHDPVQKGWVIVDFKTGSQSESKEQHYQKQLDFYKEVMEAKGYRIVDTRLLWL